MSDTERRENSRSTNYYEKIRMKRKTDSQVFDISDSSSDSIQLAEMKSPFRWGSEQGTSENLYGLNPRYIESIGIKPPLGQWVHVSNFRCDKAELKEVLELAGHVVVCSVIFRERYAKVMYSHPLEAVQAIAMLHGQVFYGQKLKLNMLSYPMDTLILPKGLTNVGGGLGVKGKPLRDVVNQYKHFLKHKESMLDTTIFAHSDQKDWNFDRNDLNKSLSNISDSSFNDDYSKPNKAQDNFFKRDISFKTMNVEDTDDFNESSPPIKKSKFESENNARGYPRNKSNDRTDRPSCETDSSRNKNVQSSRNIQNFTHISAENPSSAPNPVFNPQSFNSNHPGNSNISRSFNSPQGINMGPSATPRTSFGAVHPRMPLNSGPPGPNMRPSGPPMMMNPAGPMGVMNGPGPVGANMGSIRMNMGPGVAPGVNINNGPGGYGPQGPPNSFQMNAPPQDSFEIQFRNLPPSTTFPLLCEKVSLCGQVLSLQLTTPGCAVARFSQRAHAEKCCQVFSGLRIDGWTIETRLV